MDPAKQSVLDLAINCYVAGIRDPTLRLKMIKYPTKETRSLYGAFIKAEAEQKQINAEKTAIKSIKVEAENTLLRKMKEHVLVNQSVPHQLVRQLKDLTKEEALPLYYPDAQLSLDGTPAPVLLSDKTVVTIIMPQQTKETALGPPQQQPQQIYAALTHGNWN